MNVTNLPVLIINLATRPDRWDSMLQQLSSLGFNNITRIDAVVGKNLDLENIDITLHTKHIIKHPEQRSSHYQLHTVGAIGCTLSHLKCYNYMLNNNINECLIFEDDCLFTKDFASNLTREINICKSNNMDLLVFGYNKEFDPEIKGNYKTVNNFFGTHSYYINKTGAQVLKQYIYPIEVHMDAYISLLLTLNKINGMLSVKSICFPDDFGTDIEHGKCIKCYINNSTSITYLQKNISIKSFKQILFFLLLSIVLFLLYIFFKRKIKQ